MSSILFKKEIHLKADNEQETAQNGLLSFVDITRSGIQILKRSKAFKAIEFIDFRFPTSTDDDVWSRHISDLLGSDEFRAHAEGSETAFSVSDPKIILVPTSLYSEKEKVEHFEFLFGRSDHHILVSQALSKYETTGIFSVPAAISNSILKPDSSYLNWLDGLPTDSDKVKVNLFVGDKQFALVIFKDGKLLFSNWFEYGKADDVLYYLMASLETLQILHSDIELVFSGAIDKGDEVHNTIAKFISKLSFAKRPKNLMYSYSFKEIPEHRYPFIFASACA